MSDIFQIEKALYQNATFLTIMKESLKNQLFWFT